MKRVVAGQEGQCRLMIGGDWCLYCQKQLPYFTRYARSANARPCFYCDDELVSDAMAKKLGIDGIPHFVDVEANGRFKVLNGPTES